MKIWIKLVEHVCIRKGIKIGVNKFFSFLSESKLASAKIEYSINNPDNSDEMLVIRKNLEENETKIADIYSKKDGSSNGIVEFFGKDHIRKNLEGKLISGTFNGVKYTVTYSEDGSFSRNYEDGEIANYDKDSKYVGGTLSDGTQIKRLYGMNDSSYELAEKLTKIVKIKS